MKNAKKWQQQWETWIRQNDVEDISANILKRLTGLQYIKETNLHPLQPFFLSEELYLEMMEAGNRIGRLICSLPKRIFQHDPQKLLEFTGFSADFIEKYCLIKVPELDTYVIPFSRPDAVLVNRKPKFIEFNISSAVGGMTEMHIASELFDDYSANSLPKLSCSSYTVTPFKAMSAYIKQLCSERSDSAVLAICEWGEENPRYFLEMADALSKEGVRAFFCTPQELTRTSEGLFCSGERVHYVYFGFALDEVEERMTEIQHIFQAAKEQQIHLLGDFIEEVLSNKALLTFLTDDRYKPCFTEEEWSLCQTYIPWSRVLKDDATTYQERQIDLIAFAKENKNRFVLKPSNAYGGKGIIVGAEKTREMWEKSIHDAFTSGEGYVLQEYFQPDTFHLLMLHNKRIIEQQSQVVFGPFLIGGMPAGCLIRASTIQSGAVINAKNGAQMFHPLIVRDRMEAEERWSHEEFISS